MHPLNRMSHYLLHTKNARMAELVDALVSGTSVRTDVQVRVLFRAYFKINNAVNEMFTALFFCGVRISVRKTDQKEKLGEYFGGLK